MLCILTRFAHSNQELVEIAKNEKTGKGVQKHLGATL